ncbi:MAG: AIM24 family protein [Thermodesulfobacteria bacterium]|nr:AIM24 family protein [Thermodesulfobacteriota bacterium]
MKILPRETDFYSIKGDNLEMLQIRLNNKPVFAEAGKMVYMKGRVSMDTRLSTKEDKGFLGKILEAGERIMAKESLFLTYFEGIGEVGFAGDFPGRIIPVQLNREVIYAQRDAFLAGMGDIEISVALQRNLRGALFGGEGFILEKISGEGIVFLHAGGDLIHFSLGSGETIRVDTGCAVAWDGSVAYDIQLIKNIKTSIFGGEGLFLNTLTGPGRVIIQTMPITRLRRELSITSDSSQKSGFLAGLLGGMLSKDI